MKRLLLALCLFTPKLFAWTNGELLIWMDNDRGRALTPIIEKFKTDLGLKVTIETPEKITDSFPITAQAGKGPFHGSRQARDDDLRPMGMVEPDSKRNRLRIGPDSGRGWKDRATICRGLRSIYQPLKPQPGFGEGILGALPPNRRCACRDEQREADRRPCVSLDVPKAGAKQPALARTEGVGRLWTGHEVEYTSARV